MNLTLLNLILNIGRIFAITPSSTETKEKRTICQVLHSSLMVLVYVACALAKSYFCGFYKELYLTKLVVVIARESSTCAFTSCVVIEALKGSKWNKLTDNLKLTANLLNVETNSQRKTAYVKFLGFHLIFWAIVLYVDVYNILTKVSVDIRSNLIEKLQSYINFLYSFYIYVLLDMVILRYRRLKEQFDKSEPQFVSEMEHVNSLLSEIVDILNDIIGWPIFFLTLITTTEMLLYSDAGVRFGSADGPTLILLLMCHAVTNEAETILLLVYRSRTKYANSEIQENFYKLGGVLSKTLPSFSAAGFFVLNRSTLLNIFGTVISFLIVLLQTGPPVFDLGSIQQPNTSKIDESVDLS
ncbi:7tm 7 domain containing protein [Asbolus verrucosus]|uniref:Gustatory receptor n=1 Tax=Asbolus verrucosus TaxID=1661398 RepID=A0A482VE29_ASBVE|nr:7tm 7 domain containing protein [Asbolus verrucosus]